MIVDLHIHTNRSSYCSSLHPQEMIDRARELGLDAVAVTEHSVARGAQIAHEMGLEQGFLVLRGIEVYTNMGDVLVFGLGGDAHYDADFFELMEEVRSKGAYAIAAHPTRGYWGHHRKYKGIYPDEALSMVDAIETHNGQNKRDANRAALRIAGEKGLPGTGGSDAHQVSHLGKCVTVLENDVANEEELIRELWRGGFRGAYLSEMRGARDSSGEETPGEDERSSRGTHGSAYTI